MMSENKKKSFGRIYPHHTPTITTAALPVELN